MTGVWHPLSAVYLGAPRVLASPAMLRLVLAGEGRADIVYAGDGMWPAIRHGQALVVRPLGASLAGDGDVVLAVDGGTLHVVRLSASEGRPAVAADADPAPPRPLGPHDLYGRVEAAPRRSARSRALTRAWLDVVEAATRGPDPLDDPAETVRDKYDGQAVHYARLPAAVLEPQLAARITARVDEGERILVAGSGAGREAFAIEALGYRVTGVDFAPRMVGAAQAEAARRGSAATFVAGDLRRHEEPAASLGAVVFTYDVYSFIPGRRERIALLRRLRRWLRPDGVLFLSARRVRNGWDRAVLSVQWASRAARFRASAWGDSHTRWLDGTGNLKRSFVHVFTGRALDRETASAGFVHESWAGDHGLFAARSAPPGEPS